MTSPLTAKIETVAADQLEPGERITATLPYATSGVSPWLISFSALGAILGSARMQRYGVVVTNQRLFLLRYRGRVRWTASLEETHPLTDVRVASFERGMFYGKLVLEWPGDGSVADRHLVLSFTWSRRKEAESAATALGRAPAEGQ